MHSEAVTLNDTNESNMLESVKKIKDTLACHKCNEWIKFDLRVNKSYPMVHTIYTSQSEKLICSSCIAQIQNELLGNNSPNSILKISSQFKPCPSFVIDLLVKFETYFPENKLLDKTNTHINQIRQVYTDCNSNHGKAENFVSNQNFENTKSMQNSPDEIVTPKSTIVSLDDINSEATLDCPLNTDAEMSKKYSTCDDSNLLKSNTDSKPQDVNTFNIVSFSEKLLDEYEVCKQDIYNEESNAVKSLFNKFKSIKKKIQYKGSSRYLKAEGDSLYEKGLYIESISQYTKAIEKNDETAKLVVLYGNRSAAFFMCGNFISCVSDIQKILEFDQTNLKIIQRGVKAAIHIGKLVMALSFIKQYENETSDLNTFTKDKVRLVNGVELLKELDKSATSGDSRKEAFKMLMADFHETFIFKQMYCEELFKVRAYDQISDILGLVNPLEIPVELLLILLKSHYYRGFEYFEIAKKMMSNHPVGARHSECLQVLQTINLVDEGKIRGNEFFSNKKFAQSIDYYSRAIAVDPTNEKTLRILYCNRAAAYKEIGRYKEGAEDCTAALKLDNQFSKAYARRARCREHMGDYFSAIKDYKQAIKYDPYEKELYKELRNAEQLYKNENEREKDYYFILQITKHANDKEIKLKYRELSLKWHPDKCTHMDEDEKNHAEKKFKAINQAYVILSDTQKRREYDNTLEREKFSQYKFNFKDNQNMYRNHSTNYKNMNQYTGPNKFEYGKFNKYYPNSDKGRFRQS